MILPHPWTPINIIPRSLSFIKLVRPNSRHLSFSLSSHRVLKMALRKNLAERLINNSYIYGYRFSSPAVSSEHPPVSPSSSRRIVPPNAVKTDIHREYITSPESTKNGFFRRFLQRRGINQSASSFPDFLSLPVGDKLREKLKSINITGNRIRLEEIQNPAPAAGDSLYGLNVDDARKLLKLSQIEKVKTKLRGISESSISYDEFVQVCVGNCGSEERGNEFAKLLDDSGFVIVFGNVVFLRPEQVLKLCRFLNFTVSVNF